jgi:two-component system sensor histidine kinase DegS
MSLNNAENTNNQQIEDFSRDTAAELEKVQSALKEKSFLLESSQNELTKLTNLNSEITSRMQLMHSRLDSLSKAEIKAIYDEALTAQQRLFVMRGQQEKFQSEQTWMKQYIGFMEKAKKAVENVKAGPQTAQSSSTETVEMLMNVQEVERQRLSRQMHDGPAQALSNFILQTEIAMRLFDIDPARAKEELANLKNSAMSTFTKVRNFIFELRPMMLDDIGLVPTVKRYIETIKEQSGLDISFMATGIETRLESYIEVMIFRSVQELLGNAVRHSQATQVKVQLNIEPDIVKVSVDDNGKGFSMDNLPDKSNLGLKLIKDRCEMLGGHLVIDSTEGRGTRVSFEIPLNKRKSEKK